MDLDAIADLITQDETRARFELGRAWDDAAQAGDAEAAWEVAGAMLLAINLDFLDFRGASLWCRRFAEARSQGPAADVLRQAQAGQRAAMRLCAAWLVWPSLDHGVTHADPDVRAASRALTEGLRSGAPLPVSERFLLGKCLLDHHSQQMDTLGSARLVALQQEHLLRESGRPDLIARWWFLLMDHHDYFGENEAALHARTRLQALVDAHGLTEAHFALLTVDMPATLKARQMGRAERIYRELEALMPEMRPGFLPQGLRAQAMYLAQRGDFGAALARIDRQLALCTDLEVPERDQGAYRALRANVLTGMGRFAEAIAELEDLQTHQLAAQGELVTVLIQFTEAAARLDACPNEALEWLSLAMTRAARLQFNRFFLTLPELSARLCQAALDAGIEPEFTRATIRGRHLTAPDRTRADWPWRLRVHVLGELAIWRDELPLLSSGKSQRKPLELLALLAAHGGGPVDGEAIIDALWPSLDADAPKASLEMAVSRLRKLLELPEAVLVADGSVALEPALVWCDAVAFERLAEELLQALQHPGDGTTDAALSHRAERLFALYRDRLLGSESLAGRMRLARERLASSYYGAVTAWGARLEAQREWATAIALYERALTREALAEPIYRALMRAHLALGERAEALRTFRRCRELLATVLGTTPATETMALFHEASAAA